jgi:malonyl-CoA decarboxylase
VEDAARGSQPLTALGRARRWWRRIAATIVRGRERPPDDLDTVHLHGEIGVLLAESRIQRGGEISARGRVKRIAAIYRASNPARRAMILGLIGREFAPDRTELESALAAVELATDDAAFARAEARLRLALDTPRANFLAQFNLLPDGVKFLVDLRADLLEMLEKNPALEVLRVELDGLLRSWFDPGFLELQRITWQSPALVLEKLMNYEAVHPIRSWTDMRNRLDTDRRCYAFFHPRLPDEPLIFVEIALVKGLPDSVQSLLDESAPLQDPTSADTAIFYSISNTQRGLRGISFGNLLLKRVIEGLRRDLPRLSVFATLSPIPGFRQWLDAALADGDPLLEPAEAAALGRPDWHNDAKLAETLRAPLERLCARYLMREKAGLQPLDTVAAFHLNNGARVDRLFWLADTSERGMRQSYGMMASYRYELSEVDRNHERFLGTGEVAASRRVQRLLD